MVVTAASWKDVFAANPNWALMTMRFAVWSASAVRMSHRARDVPTGRLLPAAQVLTALSDLAARLPEQPSSGTEGS